MNYYYPILLMRKLSLGEVKQLPQVIFTTGKLTGSGFETRLSDYERSCSFFPPAHFYFIMFSYLI